MEEGNVEPDAVPVVAPGVVEFDYVANQVFWQGIHPASQEPPTDEDTKTFLNFKRHVEGEFRDARDLNLEKILKFEKRCFGIKVDRVDDPVPIRSFMHSTKCFGPYIRARNSCIHLEQVNKFVSYTITQDNKKMSPFAGWMTQGEAEICLRDTKPETYLFRFSEEYMDQGGFSLAVKANADEVRHYRILGDPSNAVQNETYNAQMKLVHELYEELNEDEETYRDIVHFVKDRLNDEIEDNIYCTYVCPNLPYSALFKGYD